MRPLPQQKILGASAALLGILFGDIVAPLSHGALGQCEVIPSEFMLIVFKLRLPRIALGILVGAALSTAGAGFQALLRNPLAGAYVLGVSSGAALGTLISLIAAPHVV